MNLSRRPNETEFVELWPSAFLIQPLPDCQQPNTRLSELAISHSSQGVFGIKDAAIDWLRTHVAHGISQYLRVSDVPAQVGWGVRARFEVLRQHDYRSLANLPGAYLGGLYIVRAPDQSSHRTARDDLALGKVSFYDPRMGMNMNAISQDPYNNHEQTLSPEPGLLLLWPAFVSYFAHPILTAEPAIRVSFAVQLRG